MAAIDTPLTGHELIEVPMMPTKKGWTLWDGTHKNVEIFQFLSHVLYAVRLGKFDGCECCVENCGMEHLAPGCGQKIARLPVSALSELCGSARPVSMAWHEAEESKRLSQVFTVQKAALELGLRKSELATAIADGRLATVVTKSGHKRITMSEMERFAEEMGEPLPLDDDDDF